MTNPESKRAYKTIRQIRPGQQGRVLEILRENKEGLTREEISRHSGMKLQSVCGRCTELLKIGAIEPKTLEGHSDYNEVRQTQSGHLAAVLVAVVA